MARELRVNERSTVSLPPNSVGRIVSAKYGKNAQWADVTETVRSHVDSRGAIDSLPVENHVLGGDPCHGIQKELVVTYMGPAPATPCDDVPMKIQVRRGSKVVQHRRVCLTRPQLEVMFRIIQEWVNGEFTLQYVDGDGDAVTVCTQPEWEECIRLWGGASGAAGSPLRLIVQQKAEGTHRYGPRCDQRSCSRATHKPDGSDAAEPFTVHAEQHARSEDGSAPTHGVAPMQTQQAVVSEVLNRLLGDNAFEKLSTGRINVNEAMSKVGNWLKCDNATGGCDLDINIPLLAEQLHRWGMNALEAGIHSDAAVWFTLQSRLMVDSLSAPYNLACAAAQQGDKARAFSALQDAIRRGYSDVEHMVKDADLSALHCEAEWQRCIDAITARLATVRTTAGDNGSSSEQQAQRSQPLTAQEQFAETGEKIAGFMQQAVMAFTHHMAKVSEQHQLQQVIQQQQQQQMKKEEEQQAAEGQQEQAVCTPEQGNALPQAALEAPAEEHPRFATQLRYLHAMGLCDDTRSIPLLERFGGDVQRVVPVLLDCI